MLLILLRSRIWTKHGIGLSKKKSRENRPPAYVPTSYVCQFQTLMSLSSLLNASLAPMVSS